MNGDEPAMTAPRARGPASVVTLPHQWFVMCAARDLAARPIARTLQGAPLVLFRDEDGAPAALLDRCPHRNVPLSLGRRVPEGIECAYHGWRFDGQGSCRAVPGFAGDPDAASRRTPWYAARELDGWIWVYSTPDVAPRVDPFRFPLLDDRRYTIVRRQVALRATLLAAAENVLDVPHTAYLHGGLFRSGAGRHDIEVIVRRGPDRVEAEYVGEPRPSGLIGRILAPAGGVVTHVDRFLLPSIAQVDYRLGPNAHLVATTALTPVGDFETRMHASVAFRLPVPGVLARPVLEAVVMRIVRQDVAMLAHQADAAVRFGGEQHAHTEADVLGPHIGHLLRQAARGEAGEARTEPIRIRLQL